MKHKTSKDQLSYQFYVIILSILSIFFFILFYMLSVDAWLSQFGNMDKDSQNKD